MSIPTPQQNTYNYAGDGIVTLFSYPPIFYNTTDLTVLLRNDALKTYITWALGGDYTVAGGNGAGGSITAVIAPAANFTLFIIGNPLVTQTFTIPSGGAMPVDGAERSWDKAILMLQRVQELFSKTFKKADIHTATFDLTLPNPTIADSVLAVNPANMGWVMGPTIGAIADAAANAAAAAASAAAAVVSAAAAAASALLASSYAGEVATTLLNNQAAAVNLTSLILGDPSLYRSAVIEYDINRGSGGSEVGAYGEFYAKVKGGVWVQIGGEELPPDDHGVVLSVVGATGQIQYTTTNIAGTNKFTYRVRRFNA